MSAQGQEAAPHRPIVNPEAFDLSDLWEQTHELTYYLPGLHVARFQRSPVAVHATVACNESPLKQLVTIEDGYVHDLPGDQDLDDRIKSAMGNPLRRRKWTVDEAPHRSLDPEAQHTLARRFLPTQKRIVLDQSIVVGGQSGKLKAEKDCLPLGENVRKLARVNLSLAVLIGRETAEYEEIVERAKTWSPERHRPFDWLWISEDLLRSIRTQRSLADRVE